MGGIVTDGRKGGHRSLASSRTGHRGVRMGAVGHNRDAVVTSGMMGVTGQ